MLQPILRVQMGSHKSFGVVIDNFRYQLDIKRRFVSKSISTCILGTVVVRKSMKYDWGGWGCEVSCGGHHRLRGKTTTGSALDGAVFDIAQILAYLVHNMNRSQSYLGFGHFA